MADKSLIEQAAVLNINPATGRLRRTFGENKFSMPHGITVDYDGNVWITDVGLHQVFKFDKKGEQLAVFGEEFKPGRDDKHFCKPTDVAVRHTGEVFISDGYCNARLVRVAPKGAQSP
jgi:DNA-binding beta-propeller fold protein YncE